MINKIEITEGCFGPTLYINEKNLEFNGVIDEDLKKNIIDELLKNIDKFDINNWSAICQIIVQRGDFLFDDVNSKWDNCEQCGNYNYNEIYKKNYD